MRLLVASILCITVVSAQQLPKDIPRCKVGDVVCISQVATQLIKSHPKGYPSLGLPAIEPFKVQRLKIDDDPNRQVSLKIDFKNIVAEGISKTVVERVVGFEKDPTKSKFEIYAKIPKVKLTGNYKANGQILVVPVHGQGKFMLRLDNLSVGVKFKPKVTKKHGKSFLSVDKIKALVEPENLKIHLERAAGSDSLLLGTSLNDFLNENWREVWQQLYPSISAAFLEVAKTLIEPPLSKFAYEGIFA